MKLLQKPLFLAALAAASITAAQADNLYDAIAGQGFSMNDSQFTALSDDLNLAGSGPMTLTGASVLLFNSNTILNGNLTLNIYDQLNVGASWTRGALLGTATTFVSDNGTTQLPVSFSLNMDTFSEHIVAEIVLPGPSNTGIFVNVNPVVGTSENRFMEDGSYVTYGGVQNNMAIQVNGFQAVPEPASMAALGIGAFGLLRRRAKKPAAAKA